MSGLKKRWYRILLCVLLLAALPSLGDQQTPPIPKAAPPALSATAFNQDIELVNIPGQKISMMKYAVTFQLWDTCVVEGGCQNYVPSDESWGRGRHPVVNVSYEDAFRFAQWLSLRTHQSFRLPTSKEWEHAARGGASSVFWWGNTFDCSKAYVARLPEERCAIDLTKDRLGTVEVDALLPNGYNLYNIVGNVWQWTSTCVDADCKRRILRGGSWLDQPEVTRIDFSGSTLNTTHMPVYGFRLVTEQSAH